MIRRAPRQTADPAREARARHAVRVLVAGLLLLAVGPRSAAAGLRPAIKGSVGVTGAITSAEVNEGGMALGLAGLWLLDDPRFSAGVMLLADDMGTETGELLDPNNGQPMGTTEILHRAVYAMVFRLDVAPAPRKGWAPLGSGTWGAYRVVDDVRGDLTNVEHATGFSLAAGLRYGFRTNSALAGVVRYHRVFDERVGRYIAFGAEYTWQ